MNLSRIALPFFLLALILSGFLHMYSALTALLLITLVAVGFSLTSASKTWQSYALTKLMLVYLLWLLIVTLLSSVPNSSVMALAALAGLPIMYLVTTNMPQYFADSWKILRIALLFIGVCFGVMAIWQVSQHFNANGPLDDRNAFAALMNLIWFPACYLLLVNKSIFSRQVLPFPYCGLFVISLALFSTASRGGIATWLILMPVLLWAGYQYTKSKRLIGTILLIALLGYFSSSMLLHSSVSDRPIVLSAISHDESVSARMLMWTSAVKMSLDHPLLGVGWGGFSAYYPAYRSQLDYSTTGLFAHNDYLQFAVEGGVVALVLVLSILLALLYQLKRSLNLVSEERGLEATMLLLGVLALFIHAGVNFIFNFTFMNILMGLYLARASQLIDSPKIIKIPSFSQIRPSVKRLLLSFLLLLVSYPYIVYLISMACLQGNQLGLKAINLIAPNVSAYNVASLITTIRPQEGVAQLVMLKSADELLSRPELNKAGSESIQRQLLLDTIKRFEYMRSQNAQNPDLGVLEVELILAHHSALDNEFKGAGAAYEKMRKILIENLKANPYHANSMIAWARLEAIEGNREAALQTLKYSINRVLVQREQQLIFVETLRQFAAPEVIPELDVMEKQLHDVATQYQTDNSKTQIPDNFYAQMDEKLQRIKSQIELKHKK